MYIGQAPAQTIVRIPVWLKVMDIPLAGQKEGAPIYEAQASYAISVQPGVWTDYGGEVPSDREGKIHFDDVPVSATVGDTKVPVQKVRFKIRKEGYDPQVVEVLPTAVPKSIDLVLKKTGYVFKWWHVAVPVFGTGLTVLIWRLATRGR